MHVTPEAPLNVVLKLLVGGALCRSLHLIECLGLLYALPSDIPSLTALIADDTTQHKLDSKTVRQLRTPGSQKYSGSKVSHLTFRCVYYSSSVKCLNQHHSTPEPLRVAIYIGIAFWSKCL